MPGRRFRAGHGRRDRDPADGTGSIGSHYAAIFQILDRIYPDAGLALAFSTPFELLIALILAAQCPDARVNRLTRVLFRRYRTAEDWLRIDRAQLEGEIYSSGYYRNKARAIQACCRALVSRFEGAVPDRLEDLVSLPGIGRATANTLRSSAFGQPAIGVDTHVLRLAHRLGFSRRLDGVRVEHDLNEVVPDGEKARFGHLLARHGQARCHARSPDCRGCELKALCPYPTQGASRETATEG